MLVIREQNVQFWSLGPLTYPANLLDRMPPFRVQNLLESLTRRWSPEFLWKRDERLTIDSKTCQGRKPLMRKRRRYERDSMSSLRLWVNPRWELTDMYLKIKEKCNSTKRCTFAWHYSLTSSKHQDLYMSLGFQAPWCPTQKVLLEKRYMGALLVLVGGC